LYHIEGEQRVAALGRAILTDVFPFLAIIVFLRFGPGVASGEVERVGIRRPGEGMDFFFALRDGEGFAAVGRDQIDLADFVVFVFSLGFIIGALAFVRVVRVFFGGGFAVGEKRDPAAVRGPLWLGVVAGLR
jgi:hypothetical protein